MSTIREELLESLSTVESDMKSIFDNAEDLTKEIIDNVKGILSDIKKIEGVNLDNDELLIDIRSDVEFEAEEALGKLDKLLDLLY